MEYVITLILLLAFIGTALSTRRAEVLFGLFLLSALLTIPVMLIGHSAPVFAIDLLMLVVIYRVGSLATLPGHFFLYVLNPLLLAVMLCIASSIFNVFQTGTAPLNLYIFTTIKFIQYLLAGILMTRVHLKKEQLEWMLGFVVAGCLIYQSLMAVQFLQLLDLSGTGYFTPRTDAVKEALIDQKHWFLAAGNVVIGGFSVINAFLGLLAMYFLSGKKAYMALALFLVAIFDVMASQSRPDIVGLIAGIAVFAIIFPALKLAYPLVNRWLKVLGTLFCVVMVLALLLWPNWDKSNQGRVMQQADRILESNQDGAADRQLLLAYFMQGNIEVLTGSGPGNFKSYQTRGITLNAMGHNAYLHWLGELGLFGLVAIVWWCFSMLHLFAQGLTSQLPWIRLVALGGLAILISRCVAAWTAESIWGVDGSGYYSLYFIGICYLCAGIVRREKLTDD